jgi:hypothetical protein
MAGATPPVTTPRQSAAISARNPAVCEDGRWWVCGSHPGAGPPRRRARLRTGGFAVAVTVRLAALRVALEVALDEPPHPVPARPRTSVATSERGMMERSTPSNEKPEYEQEA